VKLGPLELTTRRRRRVHRSLDEKRRSSEKRRFGHTARGSDPACTSACQVALAGSAALAASMRACRVVTMSFVATEEPAMTIARIAAAESLDR
jgi:hypothetical protein